MTLTTYKTLRNLEQGVSIYNNCLMVNSPLVKELIKNMDNKSMIIRALLFRFIHSYLTKDPYKKFDEKLFN